MCLMSTFRNINHGEVVSIFSVCGRGLVEGVGTFKDQARLWGFITLSIKCTMSFFKKHLNETITSIKLV